MRTDALIRSFAFGAAALVGAACTETGTPDNLADKVGNPAPPVTLTLVTSEIHGRPGGDTVERFVAAVEELSDGRVTVVPTFDHPPDQPPAWDQVNLRAFQAGDFDLAFVPARAWHAEGVLTLEPLQLPFLVETDAQADRVASDQALADALLGGLAEIGVTGLGLYPEGLRHVVRLDGTPISSTGDLAGVTVRAPLSVTTWTALRALGAEVVDLNGAEFRQAALSGQVSAAETSLSLAGGVPAVGSPSVLANVSLYTKFNVLAITDAALAELDDQHVAILHDAAAAALDETIAARPSEPDALADACAAGVGTIFATDAERQALRTRLTPVTERITAEAGVAPLVEQVGAVAGEASLEEPRSCPDATGNEANLPTDPSDLRPVAGDLPNGTYRFAVDPEMILAAYPSFPRSAEGYSGTFTVELDDGQWTLTAVDLRGQQFRYSNIYEVDGDVVTFAVPSGEDARVPIAVHWRWSAHPDGSLSFQPFGPQDLGENVDYTDLWTIPVWVPIG